ncbi:MAG: MFS transporter [Ardenticatenaceae bacterium]|nr:MFS transporter [Ardenticatenaceae bacterium]
MFPALRRRSFRFLWLGNLAPQLSNWIQSAALGWLTLSVTGQPFYLGLVAFTRGLPAILFAVGSGVLVDRFNRRQILLINQVVGFLVAATMAFAVITGRAGVAVLLLFAFLMGTISAVQFPLQQTLLSDLSREEDLVNAVALNAIGNHGSRIAGPSIAGLLIQHVHFAAAFAVQAVAYLWGFLCFGRIETLPRHSGTPDETSVWRSMRLGWTYVRATPEVAAVIGLAATFFLVGMSFSDLMPYFARERLHADAAQFGQLLAAVGWGAFVASILLGLTRTVERKGPVMLVCCAVYGVMLIFLGLASDFWSAVAALILLGASSALYFTMNQTLIQMTTPPPLRGRVLGIYFLASGSQPLGSLMMGAVAQSFGTTTVFVLAGLVCLASALVVAIAVPALIRPPRVARRSRV